MFSKRRKISVHKALRSFNKCWTATSSPSPPPPPSPFTSHSAVGINMRCLHQVLGTLMIGMYDVGVCVCVRIEDIKLRFSGLIQDFLNQDLRVVPRMWICISDNSCLHHSLMLTGCLDSWLVKSRRHWERQRFFISQDALLIASGRPTLPLLSSWGHWPRSRCPTPLD